MTGYKQIITEKSLSSADGDFVKDYVCTILGTRIQGFRRELNPEFKKIILSILFIIFFTGHKTLVQR